MSSSRPPALEQLNRLDRSSSGFSDQLSNVLHGEVYQECVPNLQGDDSAWLVDYLDEALNGLDPTGPTFRKCQRELRNICGVWETLPTSYTLPSFPLHIGPEPFASGGYGDVYHGILNGARVCVKRVRVYAGDQSQNGAKTFCQEAVMWKRLTHPNTLPLLGITISPFQLISNWMPGGDLPEYIRKNPDVDRLGLLSDAAEGLCYLHSCNVIHGDLKGPNILVDNSGRARLADFGLAKVAQGLDSVPSASHQHGHTPRWTAPEILNEEGTCSKEADIFSFAMVIIEAFTGAVPFSNCPSMVAALAIVQGKRPPQPTHPAFTEDLWALVKCCWDQSPHLRPEVQDVLKVFQASSASRLFLQQLRLLDKSLSGFHDQLTEVLHGEGYQQRSPNLQGDDLVWLVDYLDQALDDLHPSSRAFRKCLHELRRICGARGIVPTLYTLPSQTLNIDPHPFASGGCGDVYHGTLGSSRVCIKRIRVYTKDSPQTVAHIFCQEAVVWKHMTHPNILPLLGVTTSPFQLISNWMAGGDLPEYIRKNPNADRHGLVFDIANGIYYLHSHDVIHGAIKGLNILVGDSGRACIAGFGHTTVTRNLDSMQDVSHGLGYCTQRVAPEVLFGGKDSKAVDIFAFAMVVIEVFTGAIAFSGMLRVKAMLAITQGERPPRPTHPTFTDGLWALMQRCWDQDPHWRPEAAEVLQALLASSFETNRATETDAGGWSNDRASGSGDGPPIPPLGLPRRGVAPVSSPPATHNENSLPVALQQGSSEEGWVGRVARDARKTFKSIARKFPRT